MTFSLDKGKWTSISKDRDTSLRQLMGLHEILEQMLFLWLYDISVNAVNKDDMLIEKAKSTLILYNGRFTLTSQSTGDKHCC